MIHDSSIIFEYYVLIQILNNKYYVYIQIQHNTVREDKPWHLRTTFIISLLFATWFVVHTNGEKPTHSVMLVLILYKKIIFQSTFLQRLRFMFLWSSNVT